MSNLGVVHSSASATTANAMNEAVASSLLAELLSLKINKEMVEAFGQANKVQANAAYNQTIAQADIYHQEYIQSLSNTIVTGGAMTLVGGYNLFESRTALKAAESEANTAGNYEKEFGDVRKNKIILEEQRPITRETADELKKMKSGDVKFTDKEDAEANLEVRKRAVQVADDTEYEAIMKKLRDQKKSAEGRVERISSEQNKRVNYANIFTNVTQSAFKAIASSAEADIERVKARADLTRSLSDYIVSILQQLMQTSLAFSNQQQSAQDKLIQAQSAVASGNRAV